MSKNEADFLALGELLSPLLKQVDPVQPAIEFAESKAVSEDELDEETAEELRRAEFDEEWERRRTEKRLAVLYRGTGRTPPQIPVPDPKCDPPDFAELGAAMDDVLPILSEGWPKLAAQLRVYRQQIEDRDETGETSFNLEKFHTWLKLVTGTAPATDDAEDEEVEPKPAHAASAETGVGGSTTQAKRADESAAGGEMTPQAELNQAAYSSELVGNKIDDPTGPLKAAQIATILWGKAGDAEKTKALRWMKSGKLPANLADSLKDHYCVSKSQLDLLEKAEGAKREESNS